MPRSLKVVVGLICLNIALRAISLSNGMSVMTLIVIGFWASLLYGILRGNEGVRGFIIVIAWLNICMAAVNGLVIASNAPEIDGLVVFVFGLVGLQIFVSGFIIWCLSQDNVRDWMFNRNFRLDE